MDTTPGRYSGRASCIQSVGTPLATLLERRSARGIEEKGLLFIALDATECGLTSQLAYEPREDEHRNSWTPSGETVEIGKQIDDLYAHQPRNLLRRYLASGKRRRWTQSFVTGTRQCTLRQWQTGLTRHCCATTASPPERLPVLASICSLSP